MREDHSKIKVSVISPVYMDELWIDECISSLLSQTLSDTEFIFVDDCGGDGSVSIVEKYASEDSRFRVIRNPHNIGPGASRNHGIKEARGEYLAFMDTDDFPAPDYLERLYRLAKDTGSDIAKGCRVLVDDSGSPLPGSKSHLNDVIRRALKCGRPLFPVFEYEHNSAIYSASFLLENDIFYGTERAAEDTLFLLRCLLKTDRIAIDDSAFYYYRRHGSSLTSRKSLSRSSEEIDSLNEQTDALMGCPYKDDAYSYLRGHVREYMGNLYHAALENDASTEETAALKAKLADAIRRMPFYERLLSEGGEIRVFMETGRIIPPIFIVSGRLDRCCVTEWMNLAKDHPEYTDECVSHVIRPALRLRKEGAIGTPECKDDLAFLRRAWSGIPLKSRVFYFLKMPFRAVGRLIR